LPNNLYVLSLQENSYVLAAASMRTTGWCSKPPVYLGDPFMSFPYRCSLVTVLVLLNWVHVGKITIAYYTNI
jgi:hypothetical protein